ncbi:MAG: VOC family protein [Methanosarcinales archaeon]|jgi:PhnB protein|nr:VOC family protein [Methanosarcinales archaeon]
MTFSAFINFSGNCREAVTFYAKVFNQDVPSFSTYGDMPSADPNFSITDDMKKLVMYSSLNIGGTNVMFSDMPPGFKFIVGNNVTLVFGSKDKEEIQIVFSRLAEGGSVACELQETFYAALYGMIVDKFGITWQIIWEDGIVWK